MEYLGGFIVAYLSCYTGYYAAYYGIKTIVFVATGVWL
jgi:hypothetical protein